MSWGARGPMGTYSERSSRVARKRKTPKPTTIYVTSNAYRFRIHVLSRRKTDARRAVSLIENARMPNARNNKGRKDILRGFIWGIRSEIEEGSGERRSHLKGNLVGNAVAGFGVGLTLDRISRGERRTKKHIGERE